MSDNGRWVIDSISSLRAQNQFSYINASFHHHDLKEQVNNTEGNLGIKILGSKLIPRLGVV